MDCRFESGNWSEHTDGLLGIAYSSLYCSPSCYKTWIDEIVSECKYCFIYIIVDQSQNITDVFSICFGEERGILAIGDVDDGLYVIHLFYIYE